MTSEERMNLRRCKNDTQRGHIRKIQDYGVSILSVFDPDEDDTVWTYSIGFWHKYAHPEVLITGLDVNLAGALLNDMNRDLQSGKRRFENGAAYDDLLEGDYTCYFQTIPQLHYEDWFAGARWFYDGNDQFPAVQMIWPSLERVYPWQPAADEKFISLQPLLCSLPQRALQ